MAVNSGRFLRVNLSSGEVGTESVPEQVARDFSVDAMVDEIEHLFERELKKRNSQGWF